MKIPFVGLGFRADQLIEKNRYRVISQPNGRPLMGNVLKRARRNRDDSPGVDIAHGFDLVIRASDDFCSCS